MKATYVPGTAEVPASGRRDQGMITVYPRDCNAEVAGIESGIGCGMQSI